MTDPTAEDIRKAIRRLVWATILLFLALALAGTVGYLSSASQRDRLRANDRALRADEARTAAREARTARALCSFRHDLEERVASTQDYLAKHPATTILGVPRATIVTNLNNQERTLRSLASLACQLD